MTNPTIHVRLSPGIMEVLSLDDRETCESMGLDVQWPFKSYVVISASQRKLETLCAELESRAFSGAWDQPPWYARSAQAALRKIRRAIDMEGEPDAV